MSSAKKVIQAAAGVGGPTGGDVVFVGCFSASDRITAVDTSDPSSMSLIGTIQSATSLDAPSDICLDLDRGVAFVLARQDRKITALDISDPSSMSIISDLAFAGNVNGLYGASLDVENNVLYAVSNGSGEDDFLFSVDVSDTSNMSVLDTVTIYTAAQNGDTEGVVIDLTTQIAYVASRTQATIRSYDISNPSNITFEDSVTLSGHQPRKMVLDVTNDVLYVACRTASQGLISVDISNPSNMSELDFISTNMDGCKDITIDLDEQVVYLCDATSAVISVDVSTPSSMVQLDRILPLSTDRLEGITMDDANKVVYVADFTDQSVHSIDVSDPSSMVNLNRFRRSTELDRAERIRINIPGYLSTNAFSA